MKTAAKVMYLIGTIFAIIGFIFMIVLVVIGVIGLTNPDAQVEDSQMVAYIVTGIILSIIYLIAILIGNKGRKSLGNGKVNIAPHVLSIVFGALGGDIFFLLGGIFGLVGESYGRH